MGYSEIICAEFKNSRILFEMRLFALDWSLLARVVAVGLAGGVWVLGAAGVFAIL